MILEDYRGFDGTVVVVLSRAEFEEFKSDLHSYDNLVVLNTVMADLLKKALEL